MSDEKPIVIMSSSAGDIARVLGITGKAVVKDPIDKKPDIDGPHGAAWRCDLDRGRKIMKVDPRDDGTLVHWIVEAPWAHPVWSSYSIVLVHLRPMRDTTRKTIFHLEGATHEMWVWALDPDKSRSHLIKTGIPKGHWLSPGNYAGQFIAESDEAAMEKIAGSVKEICDGVLSPDTDFTPQWAERYGWHQIKKEFRE